MHEEVVLPPYDGGAASAASPIGVGVAGGGRDAPPPREVGGLDAAEDLVGVDGGRLRKRSLGPRTYQPRREQRGEQWRLG